MTIKPDLTMEQKAIRSYLRKSKYNQNYTNPSGPEDLQACRKGRLRRAGSTARRYVGSVTVLEMGWGFGFRGKATHVNLIGSLSWVENQTKLDNCEPDGSNWKFCAIGTKRRCELSRGGAKGLRPSNFRSITPLFRGVVSARFAMLGGGVGRLIGDLRPRYLQQTMAP